MIDSLSWIGIVFCLSQSALFSGLNIAYFSITRLRLEIEVANGSAAAETILALRKDSNFLLTTILWGNVGINVILTLLSNSVMVGIWAFLFSTVVITLGGEIVPQAYFSRNALRMASFFTPALRFYQVVLFVIAKPSAMLLDLWLGKEGIQYFRERDLRQLIHKHMSAENSDVDAIEGIGALNFLAIDDVPVSQEGELVLDENVLRVDLVNGRPQFFGEKEVTKETQKQLIDMVVANPHRWIVMVNKDSYPAFTLDGDAYLRGVYGDENRVVDPIKFCHRPVVVTDANTRLGSVLSLFKANSSAHSDAPLKEDIIVLWADQRRIITGADILGRLLKGIGLYSSIGQTGG